MAYTLGSLFDGSGGFPLAGALSGLYPVWASEIEKFPVSVTSKRFPHMKHLGDITKISGTAVEPVDVITFGSPCQDLSVSGKQKGLDGERSGLFREAVRIVKEMREATNGAYPTFIIWENVPGAFSSNRGEDFRTVLEEICRIANSAVSIPRPSGRKSKWLNAGAIVGDGYSIAWRQLDAQYWGVPQRRKRIYLVADFRGQRAGKILFEREGLLGHFAPGGNEGQEAAAGLGSGVAPSGWVINDQGGMNVYTERDFISPTLRSECHGNVPILLEIHHQDGRCGIQKDGIVQTLTSHMGMGGNNVPVIMEPLAVNQNAAGEVRTGTVAYTLNTNSQAGARNAPLVYTCMTGQTGRNGAGTGRDIAYTLDQCMGQAVAVDCRNHRTSGVSGTLQSKTQGGYSLNYINPVAVYGFQAFGKYAEATTAKTMLSTDDITTGGIILDSGYYLRRFTPRECGRLQGFPDWWCADIPHSDTAEYKMWGNGVALPCALFVVYGVAEALREGGSGDGYAGQAGDEA